MRNLLIRWLVLSASIWAADALLPGISVHGNALTYAGIAVVFGFVNATVGTVAKVFTFPVTFFTLGLWVFAINAAMLLVTAQITDSLVIDGFWNAFAAAFIISVVSMILRKILKPLKKS